ncbi:MAG TPA: DUF4388 domain-containing protein [Pyrinomonadaceae bacterium]
MYNSRFVILTGHLNDYPISDLIGILRHQRKTGRLLIEYPKGPAAFFFHEGDLVDAKVNELAGLQAVCFALGQPPASFNFNPLIQPSQQTIEDSLQRTVCELFGCWEQTNVEIPVGTIDVPLLPSTPTDPVVSPSHAVPAHVAEPLALPPAVVPSRRPASLLIMTAAGLATLGVSTVIALSGSFRGRNADQTSTAIQKTTRSDVVVDQASDSQHAAKNAETFASRARARSTRESSSAPNRSNKKDNDSATASRSANSAPVDDAAGAAKHQPESVTVVMEIENGRVLRASIANPKPGMDSYEALALRIARQRRYSSEQNGRETVKIKVSSSDQ